MDALTDLEASVRDAAVGAGLPVLDLLRWRRNGISPPSLYHMIATDTVNMPHMGKVRDLVAIQTRIAVAMGDDGYEADKLLEGYIDIYREVMDPPLLDPGVALLDADGVPAAAFVNRTNMRTLLDEFASIPYLCVEFVHTVQLNRWTVVHD